MPRVHNPLPQLVPQRVMHAQKRVDAMVWPRSAELRVLGGPVNEAPLPLAELQRQKLAAVRPGEWFGPANGGWSQRVFRVELPAAAADERGRRFLHFECLGEATAWIDGQPWVGFDPAHRIQPVPDHACTVWLDLGTYQTGIWVPGWERVGRHGLRFDFCKLLTRDEIAWGVSCDLDALIQLMHLLIKRDGLAPERWEVGFKPPHDACSPLLRLLLTRLDAAVDALDAEGLGACQRALRAVFRDLRAEHWQPLAALCGHAHIDLVWLWPEVETERKGVHTFATQLRLMERFGEVTFVQSQPALYRAIERRAPMLMKPIRKRIAEGRWEVMGGFEVEVDNQLPGGEALARSLAYGQRKTRELRGEMSTLCWIPDVFGYAHCLPQILRLGGIEFFYTTKMTWSAVTRFPYSSFVWRGSDGSEVVSHLCATGYNGNVELANLDDALRSHRQAGVHPAMLLPTGYGDGGGGLTERQCERARRFADLAGSPRTRWTTGESFFRDLAQRRDQLPVYQGELYLEYHRGTFTTQSEFKRLYRRAETSLQAHEAVRVALKGKALGEGAWLRTLFCHFHDAIPGSSIGLVYEQLNAELQQIGDRELDAAAAELAGAGPGFTVFNPLPIARQALVELPAGTTAQGSDGAALATQRIGAGKRARTLALVDLPAAGGVHLPPVEGHADAPAAGIREATSHALDNGIVRARFSRDGSLAALSVGGVDLALAPGWGLRLYHDDPSNFDAWDIDHYSLKRASGAAVDGLRLVERGPLRAVLRGTAKVGAASAATVDYVLEAGGRWLRIEVEVDWREEHRLLKFHCPTAYSGRHARFATPFGAISRPQVPGTAQDEAQWEVPMSRWAAVGDDAGGAGLALCTEAKFGVSCRDGDLGLTLLRSPRHPDPKADIGRHRIRFAVGLHRETTEPGAPSTAVAADALFAPIVVASGRKPCAPRFAFAQLGSLAPSWALPSETGAGYILRLHETAGARGTAVLELAEDPVAVERVDFLEQVQGVVRRTGKRCYEIAYAPYQIVSVRVR